MGAPTPDELRDAVDEVALRRLIATYADIVNRRAWIELEEVFVPGAPVELDLRDRPALHLNGATDVGEFIARALEQYPFFVFVALNVHVELPRRGDVDRATIRTYMCELRQDHDGGPSRAFGVYRDEVVRGPDGWRFSCRRYQSMGRGEYRLDLMPMPVTE